MTTDFHPTWPTLEDNEVMRTPIFWARCKYDFTVDGGTQGAISLLPAAAVPDGSLVLGAYINVLLALTGATATAALHINAADDIEAATAISGAPWSSTGWKAASDLPLGAAPVQLTADRNITLTVGTADLTAGEFEVIVAYLPPGL